MKPLELYRWILLEGLFCYGLELIIQMLLNLGTNLNDSHKWDKKSRKDINRWDDSPLQPTVAHTSYLLLNRSSQRRRFRHRQRPLSAGLQYTILFKMP